MTTNDEMLSAAYERAEFEMRTHKYDGGCADGGCPLCRWIVKRANGMVASGTLALLEILEAPDDRR